MTRDGQNGFERAVAELIEQVGRCAYGDAFCSGLNPAQWTALRYIARANRFSRTVTAFARYHNTTLGTASQTVKALVEKGFLRRERVAEDRRSYRLQPTAKAKRLLARDPSTELMSVAGSLPRDTRRIIAEGLQSILHELLERRERPLFGVCTSCEHLRCGECCLHAESGFECGLLDEPLAETELAELCVNWKPFGGASAASDPGLGMK